MFHAVPTTAIAITTVDDLPSFTLDVDIDSVSGPLTDGILILRHLAGFSGEPLTNGAINADTGRRTAPPQIQAWLNENLQSLNVDGDGTLGPLTDGILIIRYLAGFTGQALVKSAMGSSATRTTPESVTAYLDQLSPQVSPPNSSLSSATAVNWPSTRDEEIDLFFETLEFD